MNLHQTLAFAAVGVGALAYGGGSVLQAIGARRGAGVAATVREPAYLIGLFLDLLGWALSLVALRSLPVFVVQAILAGSLAVTVVLARLLLAAPLRRVDGVAVAVTILALAVVGGSAGAERPGAVSDAVRAGLGWATLAVAVAGAVTARKARPQVVAAIAGLAFAGAALSARAVDTSSLRVLDLLADPLVWAVAGYGATGIVLYAQALERGAVGPVTAILWITEIVVPTIIGIALLGDSVRHGWVPACVVGVAATVVAAGVLARAPGTAAAVDTAR